MRKYPKYKDCRIEWIQAVPENWEVKPLKYLTSKIGDGLHGTPNYIESSDFFFINGNNIGNGIISLKENAKCVSEEEYLSNKKSLSQNSILMSINGTIGSLAFYNNELVMLGKSVAYINCKDIVNKEFVFYCLESEPVKNYINVELSGSTIKNLSLFTINNIPIPFPPIKEQTQIAKYLDYKTNQIETLIVNKQKLIELLQEEQTAIINQAVTKGINPKAKLKPSGVDWLGDVPEHWIQSRIKYVCDIIGRIGFRGYTVADLVPKGEGAISLSPSNIKNQTLDINECTYLSWEKYNESPEIKIFQGDIIIVKTGSTIGKVALVPKGQPEMTLNPQLVVMKNIRIDSRFLYYSMISDYFQGYFNIYSAGGSTPAISQEKINNFNIAYPSIEEQIKIADYIEEKNEKLAKLEKQYVNEIELLKEYKTALISEVVTGKVDVRDEVIK
jgi:type I restriction enzyme S subunit